MMSHNDGRNDLVQQYESVTDGLFSKTYILKENNVMKRVDLDDIEMSMENQKLRLQSTKDLVRQKVQRVGEHNWHSHTAFTHPLKGLPSQLHNQCPNLRPTITQGYCKFMEMLIEFPELTTFTQRDFDRGFRSLHLCEAPGNFVHALSDFLPDDLYDQWTWRMNSLNPYHEGADLRSMLYDDSFMVRHMEKMVFGPDNTGNIGALSDEYMHGVIGETGKFHLITMDGSVDCRGSDFEQERTLYNLFHQSFKVSRTSLMRGGCLVMKIYTFFGDEMHNLLYHISSQFQKVVVHKPPSSKPGNSEVYVIASGFSDDGPPENAVNIQATAAVFLRAANHFPKLQSDFIIFNLESYSKLTAHQRFALEIHKNTLVQKMLGRFKEYISNAQRRRGSINMRSPDFNPWYRRVWDTVTIKESSYDEYLKRIIRPDHFPVVIPTERDSAPDLAEIVGPVGKVDCLSRHPAILVVNRNTRAPIPDSSPNLQCSMFCDYKLLQFAKEMGVHYTDLCKRNAEGFRKLKCELVQENDAIYVDSQFMNKSAWLELCVVVAHGSAHDCQYPRLTQMVQILNGTEFPTVQHVHIYLQYGSNLVLSRFAASVIYFTAHFFKKIAFDKKGIHFLERRCVNTDLASLLSQVAVGLPDTYDLVQFVPSLTFSNPKIFNHLLDYNNNALIHAIERLQNSMLEEVNSG